MNNSSSFLAKRFLSSSRENRFFSWISGLSILGIGIGIAVMIVVLSVMNGFENELRERFLAASPHMALYKPEGINNYTTIEAKIKKDYPGKITGVSAYVDIPTLGKKNNLSHTMLVRGIKPQERKAMQKINHLIRPANALDLLEKNKREKTHSVILGSGLMKLMKADIGDTIKIMTPNKKDPKSFGPLKNFKVIGTYDSGLQDFDNKLALIHFKKAQKLVSFKTTKAHGIDVGLVKPNQSLKLAKTMGKDLYQEGVFVSDWQTRSPIIFETIRRQRNLIALIVALVAFVGSFNILTTLFVLVIQKQKDISILKSLGATSQEILLIFFKQSTFMGIIGGLLGLVLAFIISLILSYFPFIELPDVYMLSYLPIEFSWKVYLTTFSFGVLISAIAGFYPSWRASRVLPSMGISQRRS